MASFTSSRSTTQQQVNEDSNTKTVVAKRGILYCKVHEVKWISKPGIFWGVTTRQCPTCIKGELEENVKGSGSTIGSNHNTAENTQMMETESEYNKVANELRELNQRLRNIENETVEELYGSRTHASLGARIDELEPRLHYLTAALSHRVFRVFAEAENGRRYPVDVQLSDTLSVVEEKLNLKNGDFFHGEGGDMSLVLMGDINQTMVQQFVVAGSMLPAWRLFPGTDQMKIFLKTFSLIHAGKMYCCVVFCNDSVNELKQVFERLDGMPVDDQCIMFDKKQLLGDELLKDCNIQNESTVSVSKRFKRHHIRGGGGRSDIGVFSEHGDSPGRDFLRGSFDDGAHANKQAGCSSDILLAVMDQVRRRDALLHLPSPLSNDDGADYTSGNNNGATHHATPLTTTLSSCPSYCSSR